MSRIKGYFMDLQDKIMSDLMEKNPGMTEEEAYDLSGDQAYHDLGDYMADLADQAGHLRG